MVSENWLIESGDSSIVLTYCRSCQEEYEMVVDSLRKDYLDWSDAMTSGVSHALYSSRWSFSMREDIFKKRGSDSVSFAGTLSRSPTSNTEDERQWNKPEDILRIEIKFTTLKSAKYIEEIQAKNDSLKEEILKTPLYKTVTSFDDYRAYLPQDHLRWRTERFGYYFQRLPYESSKYKYSIFVVSNKKDLSTETVLVDKSDPLYFAKRENFIEKERAATLIVVAYALGLKDFEYFGQ